MPLLDPLEPRCLLSVTWSNRGPKDGFTAAYGANAPLARTLVDAALADWSAALPAASLKVTITAANIEPRSKDPVTLGYTVGRSIKLDLDAAGGGWYFDADLADDSEFDAVESPYLASGKTVKGSDFFSVVLHEMGHVMGFKDKDDPYVDQLPRKDVVDVFHTAKPDLMNAIVDDGSRQLISPYDILHTKYGKDLKNPVAPREIHASQGT